MGSMGAVDRAAESRVGRRRDAGLVAVSVALGVAVVVGSTIAVVVMSNPSDDRPPGERGRVAVERPITDLQLPTL